MHTTLRNAYAIRVPSPDGVMFVHCIENDNKLEEIQISIGKTGSSVRAWADGLARMLTLSLKYNDINNILVELSSITTDKSVLNSKRMHIKSGPDAIFNALMMYRALVLENDTPIYKPPTMVIPSGW